jgi:hypothetical protein
VPILTSWFLQSMPTRQETAAAASQIFDDSVFPGGQANPRSVWAGFYQALLWYEPLSSPCQERTALPHIIDANRLKRCLAGGQPNAWQRRAIAVEEYIAQQWGVGADQVWGIVNRLMSLPQYRDTGGQEKQRHNTLGIAFAALIVLVLRRYGNRNPALTYELEVHGANAFPGVQIPTRSEEPKIDVLVRKSGQNIGIISTKWSYRHDRVDDLTTECRAYKSAAFYTQATRSSRLFYYISTNEFDPARTQKLIGDPCIDHVIHVHKPLVTGVAGLNGRLTDLWDLTDLIADSHKW